MKKKVILCPNPYRDSELKVAKDAKAILESIGFETVVCLPFHRDGYGDELGVPVELYPSVGSAGLLIFQEDHPLGADVRPILGIDDYAVDFEILANEMAKISAYTKESIDLPNTAV